MNIDIIIHTLDLQSSALAVLRGESQEQLREYVTDKSLPLEERFRVWIAFCDKKNHDRLDAGDVSPIGDWVEAELDAGTYSRYADYDWDHFLGLVKDYHRDPEFSQLRETGRRIPSVDEFKEFLIAENFGSMHYWW